MFTIALLISGGACFFLILFMRAEISEQRRRALRDADALTPMQRTVILTLFLAAMGVVVGGLLLDRYSIVLAGVALALLATSLSYVFD
jgi:hypothetical protein